MEMANIEQVSKVPDDLVYYEFGCVNCLWQCVECLHGELYRPKPSDSLGCAN